MGDKYKGGPLAEGPPQKPRHSRWIEAKASITGESAIFPEAALRCWSWRDVHGCGCLYPDDCLLATPEPPLNGDTCRGLYNNSGRWVPCCTTGAA
jgi:hypothetical protein